MVFSKNIANYFFTKGPDIYNGDKVKNMYSCKSKEITGRDCCSVKNSFSLMATAGYSNLRIHLAGCIPDYQAIYDNRVVDENMKSPTNVVAEKKVVITADKTSRNVYCWIEWVINANLHLDFVDTRLTNKNSCLDPITKNVLIKYLDQLGFECEGVLSDILPNHFGLVIDNWDDSNYSGLFASWFDEQSQTSKTCFLRLLPLARPRYDVDDHVSALESALSNVGKTLNNVAVLMGKNTDINVTMARAAGIPFLGCFSDRLNAGVKLFLDPFKKELGVILTLISALSTRKMSAILRENGCEFRPNKFVASRRTSSYRILKVYFHIRPHLSSDPRLQIDSILQLLPSAEQDATLCELNEDLKKFELVSKGLQSPESNLFEARAALDWLAEKYPQTAPVFGLDFTDPLSRVFEKGIVKVQGGLEAQLTSEETVALERFLVNRVDSSSPAEHQEDCFEAIVKRARKGCSMLPMTKYSNLSYIVTDTNVIQRQFPSSLDVWHTDRAYLSPSMMELRLFLVSNTELWNEQLVAKCRFNPRQSQMLPPSSPSSSSSSSSSLVTVQAHYHVRNKHDSDNGAAMLPFPWPIAKLDSSDMANHRMQFLEVGEDGEYWDDEDVGYARRTTDWTLDLAFEI